MTIRPAGGANRGNGAAPLDPAPRKPPARRAARRPDSAAEPPAASALDLPQQPVDEVPPDAAPPAETVEARATAFEPLPALRPDDPPAKPPKPPKLKKPKPVHDTFTMPRNEYGLIELLKRRAHARGWKIKKSELLRAGILALADMPDAQLFAAIAAVPRLRPPGAGRRDQAEAAVPPDEG